MVGLDLPADQRLTQPQRGVDHRFRAFAGERVGGEEHTRCYGGHHLLDYHGQRHLGLGDVVRAR